MKNNNLLILALTVLAWCGAVNCVAQLQFTEVSVTEEGAIRLSWLSESNTAYRIEYAEQLSDATDWQSLYDGYASHGSNTFILDTGNYLREPPILHPRKTSARFYRVVSEGTNTTVPPAITIDPGPGPLLVAVGDLTVTVTASTDQAGLETELYVDGELMPASDVRTNYPSANGVTNNLVDTYVINTCEWPNGSHTLFAVAKCTSDFEGNRLVGNVAVGRSVSPLVPVTFDNLITKLAFSEPFFDPRQTKRSRSVPSLEPT